MPGDDSCEVLVLGAGPAGSVAAALLAGLGRRVVCVERAFFPRFSVGESLLPRANQLLEAAGLWHDVLGRRYQPKHAALFLRGAERERFCFAEGLPDEPASTFQVPRDDFDQTLATGARRRGADVRFGVTASALSFEGGRARAELHCAETGERRPIEARFVIDASGAGRVLPRLLGVERPAGLASRVSLLTQVEGDARPEGSAEGDIWVCIDPGRAWIWVIPFSNGRSSVGLVASPELVAALPGTDRDKLFSLLRAEPNAGARLAQAAPVTKTQRLESWSTSAERLSGPGWALAGNAGEFLDPVFSSGVTLALESGSLAARLAHDELAGLPVDWAARYDAPLRKAVAVFRAFVEGWYRGDVERIFFAKNKLEVVRRYITSILAGHVRNDQNPLVRSPEVTLRRLARAVDAAALVDLAVPPS